MFLNRERLVRYLLWINSVAFAMQLVDHAKWVLAALTLFVGFFTIGYLKGAHITYQKK